MIVNDPSQTTVVAGNPFLYDVDATDEDGDELQYVLEDEPIGMSIHPTSGVITWVPGTEAADLSFEQTVTVLDGRGGSDSKTFTVTVLRDPVGVNQAPVIGSNPITSGFVDFTYEYTVTATDPDGDALTYELVTGPTTAGFVDSTDDSSKLLQWTPKLGDEGDRYFAVKVLDPHGAFDLQTFTVSVVNLNDPPSIDSPAVINVSTDDVYQYPVVASDPNGDDLAYTLVGGPAGAGFVVDAAGNNTNLLQWNPMIEDVGYHDFLIRVSDPQGLVDEQLFTVLVSYLNDPPSIDSTAITNAVVDILYRYDVIASDPNNDVLTYELLAAPNGAGFVVDGNAVNTNVLAWKPQLGDVGEHLFVVRVSDPQKLFDLQQCCSTGRVSSASSSSRWTRANPSHWSTCGLPIGSAASISRRRYRISFKRLTSTSRRRIWGPAGAFSSW